jgi:chemotaxis protein methyltransferase CheR/type IV pilus assembly protein PilK
MSAQKKMPEKVQFNPLPEMDDVQFNQWINMLEERTGTRLPLERKSFLVTNLGIRMREIGCQSYQDYFDMLSGVQGLKEWSTLVDRLTVHETRFFRHPASLDMVSEYVANKLQNTNGKVSIQSWSVACSTGEEAYSLAMVIDQAIRKVNTPSYFGVLATDISSASVELGRSGVYSERRLKDIDPSLRQQYFTPLSGNKFQVIGQLQKKVCFARKNVLDMKDEPNGNMDIIYCQNLLIYFDRPARNDIVKNMVRHLLPGGLLILGSGELLNLAHDELEKINHPRVLAYRRANTINKEKL